MVHGSASKACQELVKPLVKHFSSYIASKACQELVKLTQSRNAGYLGPRVALRSSLSRRPLLAADNSNSATQHPSNLYNSLFLFCGVSRCFTVQGSQDMMTSQGL